MLVHKLMGATGGAAGIKYVGGYVVGFAGGTSDRTITLTALSGGLSSAPEAEDFVVVYFGTSSTADRNLVVSGYTEVVELYANATGSDTNLVVAYKRMGGTPDTSLTLTGGTLSTGDAGAVAIQVWRGVDAVTPLDVTQTTSTLTNTNSINPPSITPITSGSIVVAGGAGEAAGAESTDLYTSPDLTGFISAYAEDTNEVAVGLGYHVWSSGAFDPGQFTFSGGSQSTSSCAAVTLALRPA